MVDELIGEAGLDPVAAGRARRVFSRLCTEVIAGQVLDLRLTAGDGRRGAGAAEALAHRVALLKSARYTVTRPLEFGVALAGSDPDPALERALAAYGDAVGLAFQLRDDVLGLFGDPAVTGKSRLDDLREGKRTLLVVRAMRLADRDEARILGGALGDPLRGRVAGRPVPRHRGGHRRARLDRDAHRRPLRPRRCPPCGRVPEPARTALERLAALAADRRR